MHRHLALLEDDILEVASSRPLEDYGPLGEKLERLGTDVSILGAAMADRAADHNRRLVRSGPAAQQLSRIDPERVGKPIQHCDRDVFLRPLDLRDIGSVDAGVFGKGLLGRG